MKSSIPENVSEEPVQSDKQEGPPLQDRVAECFLNGVLVGLRVYNREGMMILETPIKNGLKHGREFTYDDEGNLLLVEPYVKGKIHGIAKQYGHNGKVIGTYVLIHGTGFDIWRRESEDGAIFVSEIHSLWDGLPHGYEWHFASPAQDLWHERQWYMGRLHGIERVWNSKGKLRRGYPKFYVVDQVVSKRKYLSRARSDKTLPPYQEEDQLPHRNFPEEIQEIISW